MEGQEIPNITAIARIFYDRISKGKTKTDGTIWTIEDIPENASSMRQQVQYLIDNEGQI